MIFDNQNNFNANLHRQLPDRYSGVFASGFTFLVVELLQQLSRRQMYAFVSGALLERLRLKERIANAFWPWCSLLRLLSKHGVHLHRTSWSGPHLEAAPDSSANRIFLTLFLWQQSRV